MGTGERIEGVLRAQGTTFSVLQYDLQRRLSAVDHLSCRVIVPDQDLPEPEPLVGALAAFELRRLSDEAALHYTGEIVRAVLQDSARGVRTLVLEVRPTLWRLSARRDSRVFQNSTVREIVSSVLERSGVTAARQDWRLSASHPTLVYVVQDQETDLDFCLRLLAEAGIYFTTRYEADQDERLVFSDAPAGLGTVEGGPERLPFVTSFGGEGARDVVRGVTRSTRVRPGKVTVRDYDPTRPRLSLESESRGADEDAALEVYEFPARVTEPPEAEARAERFRQALECDRNLVVGETGALHLVPGHSFEIVDHPWSLLNDTYNLRLVELSGSMGRQFALGGETEQESHVCRFEAVPVATALRPEPRPAARLMPGVQLAVTTGPSGEEIHTDEQGRSTVQFLWDREGLLDEHSSRWMRTSQVPTGGSMLLPRMGWEVAVRYMEGDVDQPLLVERLYNGRTPPPYALPANAARSSLQTATTPGGGSSNELRMSDVSGEEQMFLNASYDMSVQVGNNTTLSIGNDHAVEVGSNQSVAVIDSVSCTVGGDQSLDVGANQNTSIGTLMVEQVGGSQSLSVGANRTHMIGGDHRRTIEGDSSCQVGGNEINLVIGDVIDSTLADFSHDVGAALIQMTAEDRSLLIGGARTESTGAAKVILANGNRGVEVGLLSAQTGGALISKVKGNSTESAAIAYTETVAGASLVKAKNVVFEATAMLSFTMGGASITLTPASVSIAGAAVNLDGDTIDVGMVLDN